MYLHIFTSKPNDVHALTVILIFKINVAYNSTYRESKVWFINRLRLVITSTKGIHD